MRVIRKITDWYLSRDAVPYWCVLLLDCLFVMFAGYMAAYFEFGGDKFAGSFWHITDGLVATLAIFLLFFKLFHTYSGIIRYSSFVDLLTVTLANLSATAVSLLVSCVLRATHLIPTISSFHEGINDAATKILMPNLRGFIILFIISTLLMFLARVAVKVCYDILRDDKNVPRTFIYGVREGGISLAKVLRNQTTLAFKIKGFVSPQGDLDIDYLLGLKVYKDGPGLVKEMKDHHVSVLIISPLQVNRFRKRTDLINNLIAADIKILMMPRVEDWDGVSEITHSQLHEVDVEDLLPRDQIQLDMDAIGEMLTGKSILITGAAGSIGSEISRQVAIFGPAELVLIDQAETPMHDLRRYMADKHPDLKVWTIVGSITNEAQMETIFAAHKPEYVFHAAAYKHVPMMEDNPAMAVQNNVFGTRIIADLAVKYGTRKFVMISTDKAVNPTNVMGCSKRICEIYCQSLSNKLKEEFEKTGVPSTQFITTRFGNVLGSNGSVVPIFREQISRGGPVLVTHPDIVRFFMLIPEACKLVLEAGTMGKGGEIFVFDMGEPVRIVDLATRMIKLSGQKDIKIQFTGLREGEKLYEEVLCDAELTTPTSNPKIRIAKVREYPYELALSNEIELLELSRGSDDMAIVRKMKDIVPEFKSINSKYQQLD